MVFSTAPQTPMQKVPGYSLDTDETLRLAMQKLKQAPQQGSATTGIPHAYVIPIPIVSSENVGTAAHMTPSDSSLPPSDGIVETTNNGVLPVAQHSLTPAHCQFAPILADGLVTSSSTSGGTLMAPQVAQASPYMHYHEAPSIANFQTFSYSPHGGFFLPAGYRLIYAPTTTPQTQPATPATPQLGNSHDGTPPGEPQHCPDINTALAQTEQ